MAELRPIGTDTKKIRSDRLHSSPMPASPRVGGDLFELVNVDTNEPEAGRKQWLRALPALIGFGKSMRMPHSLGSLGAMPSRNGRRGSKYSSMLHTPQNSASLINLPNALTIARIAAVPVFIAVLYVLPGDVARWTALAIFIAASITDWLDGYLARTWNQQSKFGAMLDPIADKLLVAAALIMLVADHTIAGFHVIAALIILAREILVSGLREFLATLAVTISSSQLAKWKTAIQMIAIALLIAGPAATPYVSYSIDVGLVLLWGASLLTIWTGTDYLVAAVRHAANNGHDE